MQYKNYVRVPTMLLTSHAPSTTLTLPRGTSVAQSHFPLQLVTMEFALTSSKYLHLYDHHKLISVYPLLVQIFLVMGNFRIVYILVSNFNVLGTFSAPIDHNTGAINHFVNVDFDFIATNAIKCTFLSQRFRTQKSCVIEYGPKGGKQCNSQLSQILSSSKGNPITSDTVNIDLHPSTRHGTEYCYQLTVSDGMTTVIVSGTFAGTCCTCG